jgi:hypothetical protein
VPSRKAARHKMMAVHVEVGQRPAVGVQGMAHRHVVRVPAGRQSREHLARLFSRNYGTTPARKSKMSVSYCSSV